jgi:hypothetical protein
MGLLGNIWSGIKSVAKSIFGDHSSTDNRTSMETSTSNKQIIYEPDRVKIAELENARMDRAIEAQKEIIQINNEMQLMIMEAHQKGFEHSTQVLKDMMRSLNEIAQERLILIENGHFEVVEKIEKLYLELEKEIMTDNDSFNMSQLPKMLEILSKYEIGSASAKLYEKSIDKQIELNGTFFTQKLSALHERQKLMVISAIASKEQVLEQSSQIVLERMRFLDRQLEHQQHMQLIPNPQQQINLSSSNANTVEAHIVEEQKCLN